MSEADIGRSTTGRASVAPARRGGRVLASFATLLALAALGLAGYPYYQRYVVGTPASINSGEFESLRTAQQRQADELARIAAEAKALDARISQQSATEAQQVVPPAEDSSNASVLPARELRIAEAVFLVQGANDRLLVTRDVRAALAMLLAAQTIVDQIDDAALADVRAALSGAIASLRDVAVVDVGGTFARLQELQKALPDLPMRGARFVAAPVPVPSDAAPMSTASVAWQKFLSLFAFHRQGSAARPPLGPDEAAYLRVNLGLMLQTAQLSLLRHDAVVYQQSLESVRRWFDDYLDTGATEVSAARAEIDYLLAVQVDRTLPDIGAPLAALRKVAAPASPVAPLPASSDTP